jgi:hypothetical protein
MSGHKKSTVTISQEEYRRLYEAEKKLEYSAFSVPEEILTDTIQQTQQSLYTEFIALEDRQKDYDRVIHSFNDQIRELEQVTAQSLVEQQMNYINQMTFTAENVLGNAVDRINSQTQEIETQVLQQHDRLQQEIIHLEKRVNRLYNHQVNLYDEASHWLQDAISLHQFVQTHYAVNQFADQEFDLVTHQLDLAISNYNNNHLEAALVTSQQSVTALTDLRLKLEKRRAEWFYLKQSVIDHCSLLLDKIQVNTDCQAIDMDGQLLDFTINVDDWSTGMLTSLAGRVHEILSSCTTPDCVYDTIELKQFLTSFFPSVENEIENAIRDARYHSLISQLRFNIANLAMLSLIQQGFRPIDGGYQDENFQSEYVARAINHEGSEVVIRVVPDEQEPMQNQLHILSNDQVQRSERELLQRSMEINENLHHQGLNVTQPIEIRDPKKRIKPNPTRIPTGLPLSIRH